METIEQLKAKHAKEIERLAREIAIAEQATVTPKRVQLTASASMAHWLIYSATSLTDALAIMNAAEIVPFWKYKSERVGFSRLMTDSLAEQPSRDAPWHCGTGPFAAALKIDQGEGYGPTACLSWYVMAGNTLCRAHCNIEPDIGPAHHWHWSAQAIRSKHQPLEWRANTLLAAHSDEYIKWGTGTRESASFEYLWTADYTDGGTEHATAQITSLTE